MLVQVDIIIWHDNPHIECLTRRSADVGHLLSLLLRSEHQTWMVDGLRGRFYLTKRQGILIFSNIYLICTRRITEIDLPPTQQEMESEDVSV